MACLSLAQRAEAVAWVARHAMTPTEYQQEFNKWSSQGLRLKCVSGYLSGANTRYAALWDDEAGPGQTALHGLNAADAINSNAAFQNSGYRPSWVSVYPEGGELHYAMIWEPIGADRIVRLGRSYAQLQSDKTSLESQGYRLFHISAATLGANESYAAIWEKTLVSAQQIWKVRMTSAEYQTEFNNATAAGYRLVSSFGYTLAGVEQYAAIWRKLSGPEWWSYGSLSAANYQTETENAYYQGYRTSFVSAHAVNGVPQFNAIWENNGGWSPAAMKIVRDGIEKYRTDFDTAGVSVAIMHKGRLVYSRGFGYANQAAGEWAGPMHRFRIASISKPITAAGILKMIDGNKFDLDDKVFGGVGVLGTQYGNGNYSTREKAISIRHLLSHTTGWVAEGPMWDNSYGVDHNAIMDWTLDNNEPSFTPGSKYDYMNLDYHVLGRIIEKYSGKTYETYIKESVLKPCGITGMELGNQTLAGRKAREVVYYDPAGGDPYTEINPKRMDANGGWISTAIDLLQFLRRIDNESYPADILSETNRTRMRNYAFTGGNYGLGWLPTPDGEGHNGCMTGTSSFMVDRNNGNAYTVLANKRTGCSWELRTALDGIMDKLEQRNEWPAFDLFPVPSSSYLNWMTTTFNVGLISDENVFNLGLGELFFADADPDKDGLTNIEEAYFGTDPNKPNRGDAVTARLNGRNVEFRWTRATADVGVSATPLYSTDLVTWRPNLRTPVVAVGRPLNGVETVQVSVPHTGDRLFMKLQIQAD